MASRSLRRSASFAAPFSRSCLSLARVEPLLIEVQRQQGSRPLELDRLLHDVVLDALVLPRQADLQCLVALELSLLEGELVHLDLEPLTPEDDLFGLFGQVFGSVHLLELAQLFA